MKIGYFVTEFPYKNPTNNEIIMPCVQGGVENGTYNLAVQMAKKGHEVFIFTSSMDSTEYIESYTNIKIYRYKKLFTIGQCPISTNLLYKPLFTGINLDIIHGRMGNLPAPLTAYLCAMIMKKRLIISYHGDWIGGYGSLSRKIGVIIFNNLLCNMILSKAFIVIALSQHHVNQSLFLKKHIDRIKIIPNGVNLEEFDVSCSKMECRNKLNLPLNKKIILFVGGLVPVKSPQILLKSMTQVIKEVPDSYLILVGDGSCKDSLKNLCTQMRIESNVLFSGYIQGKQKSLYYKSADLFVLPSKSEAFPNVLLEASAAGLPMIVSELECFKALIKDGYNGLFTKTGDELDLANKIVTLLKNDSLRETMGINAKENVKKFTWDEVAEETEKIYINLR